jgi:hypothetical protein
MPEETAPRIATPADVAAAYDRDSNSDRFFEEPETVTLPSGLVFLMRRPKPIWFLRKFKRLPEGLAMLAQRGRQTDDEKSSEAASIPKEELIKWAGFLTDMVQQVVMQPRISLTPGPDEISPDIVPDLDSEFIWKWASGQAGGAGPDLETFRPGVVGPIAPDS